MSGARAWIIGYDIASPRRLRRVARFLERRAVRIQYSLFLGRFTPTAFEHTWQGLARLINPRADDVRAWPVPDRPWVWRWGMTMPPGILIGAERSADLWSAIACAGDDATGEAESDLHGTVSVCDDRLVEGSDPQADDP